ncbi:translation initiation factor IF-2 [bacterium]|nr:translation initiation factor IF-2 [bacterium]
MAEGVKRPQKIFQLARELKIETPSIIDYLESRGYDMVRKANSLVTEEMYLDTLQKFDRNLYQQIISEQTVAMKDETIKDSDQLRKEELEKIIASKEEQPAAPKITLPEYKEFVLQKAEPKPPKPKAVREEKAETKEKAEASVSADRPEGKPGKKKRRRPDKKRKGEKKVVVTEPVEVESVITEPVKEKAKPELEVVEKRKIELPSGGPLKIVQQAPKKEKPKPALPVKEKAETAEKPETEKTEKQVPRKKLKRKRIVPKPEDQIEALELTEKAKPHRKGEAHPKPKSKDASQDSEVTTQLSKRKRKKRKGTAGIAEASGKSGKGRRRQKVDAKEVAATIRQTFAQMSGTGRAHKRYAKGQGRDDDIIETSTLKVAEFIPSQELASVMDIPVQEIIRVGLEMGMIISINQRLDRDTIELLASEFSVEVEFVKEEVQEIEDESYSEENLLPRQPVVTVMGHVDHGKTTLLDYLRRTRVAESEAGGITQHIGAYEVLCKEQMITFLDTPGHEAFTAMRARGAQVTDIVVLIVAADDRVMPQTLEAINHAKAANVPIIIAVNKIDKPSANAEAIYKQLSDNNILVEKWGGKYQSAEISAKFGKGIDNLLSEILVASELLELKADPSSRARGVVIESRLDKGLGAVATILIQSGTLKIHEPFVIGQYYGRVRSMFNELGELREEAGPSIPVQVVGFDGVPQAGDRLLVFPNEKEAREVAQRRQRQYREISMRQIKSLSLDQVNRQMKEMELRELTLLIKGDVHGSVEVLSDALMRLSTSEVKVTIIHKGVGGISESDVLLASASQSIIIGFHVRPNPQAMEVARREGVEIRIYRIIHEVVDEIRKSLEGLLAPSHEERFIGSIEIRKVFKISRVGSVAGCYVTDGKINRNNKVRLIRDDVEIWNGNLDSLKRFKDDTREVVSGFECGLSLQGFNDIRVGDRVEAFEDIELARKLEDVV